MKKILVVAALSLVTFLPYSVRAEEGSIGDTGATTPDQITLTIRDGSTTAFSGKINLPPV